MPQYTSTNLATALSQLADRLQDPGNVYWSQSELSLAIQASLKYYQTRTSFYRQRVTFPTSANQPFYDLSAIPSLQSEFGYNLTFGNVQAAIQAALMEPVTVPYAGSDQFTSNQIIAALQNRRDQFLLDSGCVATRTPSIPVPAPNTGRVTLPTSIVDILRLGWYDGVTQQTTPLFKADEYGQNSFQRSWNLSPSLPRTYSVASTRPLEIQLIPPPLNSGQLDLISVSTGPSYSDPSIVFAIPDDFYWAAYFGAMADLLTTDGQTRDPARAAYCEARYKEAVELAKLHPSIVNCLIDGVNASISGSIHSLDHFRYNWQFPSQTGTPTNCSLVGRNLLVLSPVPDGIHSVVLDLVSNMPIPTSAGEFLQVGDETLDTIMGYAEHLNAFKMAGYEFQASFPLLQNIQRVTLLQNRRLQANNFFKSIMDSPAYQAAKESPREMTNAIQSA